MKACQKQLAAAQQQLLQQQQQQLQQQQPPDPSMVAKLHQLEGALRQASADYALLLGEVAKIRGEAEGRQAALAAERAVQKGLQEEVEGLKAQLVAAAAVAVVPGQVTQVLDGRRRVTSGADNGNGSGGGSRRVSNAGSICRRESEESAGGRGQGRVLADHSKAAAAAARSREGDRFLPVQGAIAAAGAGEAGGRYRGVPGVSGAAGMSSAELERRSGASRGARERIIPPTGFS